jgi:hypothetical protein
VIQNGKPALAGGRMRQGAPRLGGMGLGGIVSPSPSTNSNLVAMAAAAGSVPRNASPVSSPPTPPPIPTLPASAPLSSSVSDKAPQLKLRPISALQDSFAATYQASQDVAEPEEKTFISNGPEPFPDPNTVTVRPFLSPEMVKTTMREGAFALDRPVPEAIPSPVEREEPILPDSPTADTSATFSELSEPTSFSRRGDSISSLQDVMGTRPNSEASGSMFNRLEAMLVKGQNKEECGVPGSETESGTDDDERFEHAEEHEEDVAEMSYTTANMDDEQEELEEEEEVQEPEPDMIEPEMMEPEMMEPEIETESEDEVFEEETEVEQDGFLGRTTPRFNDRAASPIQLPTPPSEQEEPVAPRAAYFPTLPIIAPLVSRPAPVAVQEPMSPNELPAAAYYRDSTGSSTTATSSSGPRTPPLTQERLIQIVEPPTTPFSSQGDEEDVPVLSTMVDSPVKSQSRRSSNASSSQSDYSNPVSPQLLPAPLPLTFSSRPQNGKPSPRQSRGPPPPRPKRLRLPAQVGAEAIPPVPSLSTIERAVRLEPTKATLYPTESAGLEEIMATMGRGERRKPDWSRERTSNRQAVVEPPMDSMTFLSTSPPTTLSSKADSGPSSSTLRPTTSPSIPSSPGELTGSPSSGFSVESRESLFYQSPDAPTPAPPAPSTSRPLVFPSPPVTSRAPPIVPIPDVPVESSRNSRRSSYIGLGLRLPSSITPSGNSPTLTQQSPPVSPLPAVVALPAAPVVEKVVPAPVFVAAPPPPAVVVPPPAPAAVVQKKIARKPVVPKAVVVAAPVVVAPPPPQVKVAPAIVEEEEEEEERVLPTLAALSFDDDVTPPSAAPAARGITAGAAVAVVGYTAWRGISAAASVGSSGLNWGWNRFSPTTARTAQTSAEEEQAPSAKALGKRKVTEVLLPGTFRPITPIPDSETEESEEATEESGDTTTYFETELEGDIGEEEEEEEEEEEDVEVQAEGPRQGETGTTEWGDVDFPAPEGEFLSSITTWIVLTVHRRFPRGFAAGDG